MIRPMIRPMIRSMIRSIVNPFSSAVKRHFIELDRSSLSHYTMQNSVSHAGDFEISWTAYSDFALVYGVLTDPSGDSYIRHNGSTVINLKINGTIFSFSSLSVAVNRISDFKITRTGTNAELFINDVSQGTIAVNGLPFTANSIGRRAGTDYFDGYLANVSMIDIDTPSNSKTWIINEQSSSTEQAVEGGNLITYVNTVSPRELFTDEPDRWSGDLGTILLKPNPPLEEGVGELIGDKEFFDSMEIHS